MRNDRVNVTGRFETCQQVVQVERCYQAVVSKKSFGAGYWNVMKQVPGQMLLQVMSQQVPSRQNM
jgi:hypothetical protein